MNIYYHCSEYLSHRRAGEAYMACLRALGHVIVADPAISDLIVLHDAPHYYPAMLKNMPRRPGGKIVGYAVWETPQLPRLFIEGVSLVDAVWTCSEFSCQAFSPYVSTRLLPHVVERPKVSREAMTWAVDRIGMADARREVRKDVYFYTIVDTVNPRKDFKTLLAAFAAAFGSAQNVRLVVKQYREPQNLAAFPFVIDIPEPLQDEQVAALHAVCDVYVSAHHAEAWGLPLSEALSFGNPVIATGYSGNMEFMTPENSFPVPYVMGTVSPEMCLALPELFTPDMTWATIDTAALISLLRKVYSRPVTSAFRAQAAASMQPFSPAAIQERLRVLLQ